MALTSGRQVLATARAGGYAVPAFNIFNLEMLQAAYRAAEAERAPLPAGVFEMPFVRYVVLTLVGSAIWAFGFAAAGWGLGTSYEHVHNDFKYVDYVIAVVVVLVAVALIWRWLRSSRLLRRASDTPR